MTQGVLATNLSGMTRLLLTIAFMLIPLAVLSYAVAGYYDDLRESDSDGLIKFVSAGFCVLLIGLALFLTWEAWGLAGRILS